MLPGNRSLNSPKPAPQNGLRRNLPGDRCSGCRIARGVESKDVSEIGLNGGAQWLIHIVRDRVEGAGKPRDRVVGIQRIRIVGSADPNVHVSFGVTFQVSWA